jgi:predicted Zn-dependent protease
MLDTLKEELRRLILDFPCLKIQLHLTHWQTDFLRFYKSQTNYNISKESIYANVSIYKDQKNYSFMVTNPTLHNVREQLLSAIEVVEKLPPDPDFVDLEIDLRKGAEAKKECNIDKMPLEKKIEILKNFTAVAQKYDFEIYGSFICNYDTTYIINSNGVDKKMQVSPYYLMVKAVSTKNMVTVLECFGGENIDRLDTNQMVRDLEDKVKSATSELIDVESGDYEVILSPSCISELLDCYSWVGLSAGCLDRKDTDLEGKIGEQIFPEHFTLSDIPHHSDVVNFDYSSDGHLLSELPIFDRGVFKNFFIDNYYAHKLKMTENGNSGACLVLKTGDTSLADMIKSVKRGLYISSFHYVNMINNRETSLTGLTRDGTFLIEDGQITKVVNNLRFTDKITDVINHISMIEDKGYTIPNSSNYWCFGISAASMPHVLVKKFCISSSTRTV